LLLVKTEVEGIATKVLRMIGLELGDMISCTSAPSYENCQIH